MLGQKRTCALLFTACLVFACDSTPDKLGGIGGASSGGNSGTGGGASGASGSAGAAGAGAGGASGGAGAAGAGAGGASGGAGAGGTSGAAGASGSSGAAGSAGADGGTGACNYLTQIGVQVTAVPSGGVSPIASGGSITDGFYKLVGVNLYGGATGATFWRSLRFVGNELKTVERDGSAPSDYTSTGTYLATGSEISRSITCPSSASAKLGFTAKPTSFTAYVDQGGGKIAEFAYLWHSK